MFFISAAPAVQLPYWAMYYYMSYASRSAEVTKKDANHSRAAERTVGECRIMHSLFAHLFFSLDLVSAHAIATMHEMRYDLEAPKGNFSVC